MTNSFHSKRRQLSRDAARKAAKDADDLEAAALQLGAGISIPLDESIYDQEISEEEAEAIALTEEDLESEDLDIDAVQASLTLDTESEQLISAAAEVVKKRQQLLGRLTRFVWKEIDFSMREAVHLSMNSVWQSLM